MALDSAVRQAFERALAPADVISDPVQCRAYECDGLTGYRVVPDLVLLPRDAGQVAAAVRVCHEHGVPFVARGAGTGLSGGALPVADGVVISLARLAKVLEIDPVDRRAVVEPGVTNLAITKAAAPHGLYYAPDPSSQQVCTIGGNVAENSGGAHCLKYGFTTNHVLAARGRAGRRQSRWRSAPTRLSRPGRISAAWCSARRARSGSSRRSPCG